MPTPILPVQPPNGPKPDSKPKQKEMTKEERRELQEKQRAAKQAAKATGEASGSGTKGTTKSAPQAAGSSSTSRKGARPAEIAPRAPPAVPTRAARDARTAGSVTSETTAVDRRGGGGGELRIFSHFGLQRPVSVVKGDIHPAILRLALEFSQFKITGANSRCIATLRAFQTVVQDYVTPPNQTLARHLMTHISPQISHLVAARPMSVTMGNAIRQLKLDISESDIDLPEQDAKTELCHRIDNYIRDRIDAAGEVIVEKAVGKIKDGDVILTYCRSSVVEKVLLKAHALGLQFSVIVVDSRPMLEGKRLLAALAEAGIQCTYLLLPSLGAVITEVNTVFLGAHSIHSNGAVSARAGTALVAMLAKQHSVPVVVCCETYKYSEGVQLDSFTKNELAPLGERFQNFPSTKPRESLVLETAPNLEILYPLYDLTPPANITAVVTEVGVIPPNSISAIPVALGH